MRAAKEVARGGCGIRITAGRHADEEAAARPVGCEEGGLHRGAHGV